MITNLSCNFMWANYVVHIILLKCCQFPFSFFFPVTSFLRFPTLQPLTSQRREHWERVLLTIFPSTTNTPVLTHQRMRLFLMPYMDNMFSVYLFPLPTSHFWKLVCQQSISFRYLQSILFPTLGFLSSYKDTQDSLHLNKYFDLGNPLR